MEAKTAFKLFSEKHQDKMPFSLHYSWWKEVVQDSWDVIVIEKGNEIQAVWPYLIRKKGIWTLLAQPHFTAYTGPFIAYPEGQKESTKVAFENKIYQELIDQLPKHAEFLQKFHLDFHNSLAFQWNSFEDRRMFTYIQDLSKGEEALWADLSDSCRRQIKKAEKALNLEQAKNAEVLKNLMLESYKAKNQAFPIEDESLFERIAKYLEKYQCGKILEAVDTESNAHAAIAVVWDQKSAYYLIGGAAEKHKNSGSMSLLLWEAMKVTKQKGIKHFNFEGSSVKGIEKFLRGFGGKLTAYSLISKNSSKSLRLAKEILK